MKARVKEYKQRLEVKAKIRKYNQNSYLKNKDKRREYAQRPEVKARVKEYKQRPEVKARRREYDQKWYQKNKEKKQELQFKNNNWQKEIIVNAINKLADEYPPVLEPV